MFKKFIGLIVVGLLVCVIPACSNNQDAKNDPVGVIMGNAGDREDDREMFDRDKDGINEEIDQKKGFNDPLIDGSNAVTRVKVDERED